MPRAARFSGAWEADARDWIRRQAEALLVADRVARLVRAQLPQARGAALSEALGVKPEARWAVEEVEVHQVKVDGTKDAWAVLNVLGRARLRVSGREEHPLFRGHLTVSLASLGAADYQLASAGDPLHFRIFPFVATLTTAKPVYAPGEKIILRFEVENRMGTPQRFLVWHTPFEGFMNDFLDVTPVGGGAKVAYVGPLVSRAPPGPADYLRLKPGERAGREIDLSIGYPVKATGEYLVRYKPLGDVWADETRFTIR